MPRMYQPIKKTFGTWGQDVEMHASICPQRAHELCSAAAFASAAHAILRFGGQCVFVLHRPDPFGFGEHAAIETLVFERAMLDDWDTVVIRLCGSGDAPDGAGSETVYVDDTESAAEIAVAISFIVTGRARSLGADFCLWYHPH